MNISSSTSLQDYYARERETLVTESAIRTELRELRIAAVHADYDGVGDSGQIDQISFLDDSDPAQPINVGEQTTERVESLLYALLEVRHGGWENNDGAFGCFCWNLVDGTLTHEHNQRFTDYETSVYEGFEVDTGEIR